MGFSFENFIGIIPNKKETQKVVYHLKKNDNPTMKDAAREAGVALGTVSKVINGIPVGESYRARVEEAINRLGYHVNYLLEHIRAGRLDFDEIFCNTDRLACRVRDFLTACGVRIPEDVQLIGYDGIRNYATGRYDCSTIVQPIPQIAETAVKLLLEGRGASSPVNVCLPVEYAPGGTTRE